MMDEVDLKLASLLAVPEREPDELFTLRVRQAVIADERLRAVRRRARRKLVSDGMAGAAIVPAFLLLGRLQPVGPEGMELQFFSPAMTAVIMLGIWTLVTLRPGATGRS